MLNNLILSFVLFFFVFGFFFGNLNFKSSFSNENIKICNLNFSNNDFYSLIIAIKKNRKYSNLDNKFLIDLVKSEFYINCTLSKLKYSYDNDIVKKQILKNVFFYNDLQFSYDLYKKFLISLKISELSYQKFIIKSYKINLLRKYIFMFNGNNFIYFNSIVNLKKIKNTNFNKFFLNENHNYNYIFFNILNYFFLLKVLKIHIFDIINNIYFKFFISNHILILNKHFFYKNYLINIQHFKINKNFYVFDKLKKIFKTKCFDKILLSKNFVLSKNEINSKLFVFLNRYKNDSNLIIESFDKLHVLKINQLFFIQVNNFFSVVFNKYKKKKSKIYFLQNFLNENYFFINNNFFDFFFKKRVEIILWPYIKNKDIFFFYFKIFNFGIKNNKYNYFFFKLYNKSFVENFNFLYDDLFFYFKQIKMDSFFILYYLKNRNLRNNIVNKKFIYNRFVYCKLFFNKVNRNKKNYFIVI